MIPPPQPRVTKSTRLTNDGKFKCCLVTDGSRIYFTGGNNEGQYYLKYIPVTGGDPTTISTPLLEPFTALLILDISPEHDNLLVNVWRGGVCALWIVPVAGFSSRELTNVHENWLRGRGRMGV